MSPKLSVMLAILITAQTWHGAWATPTILGDRIQLDVWVDNGPLFEPKDFYTNTFTFNSGATITVADDWGSSSTITVTASVIAGPEPFKLTFRGRSLTSGVASYIDIDIVDVDAYEGTTKVAAYVSRVSVTPGDGIGLEIHNPGSGDFDSNGNGGAIDIDGIYPYDVFDNGRKIDVTFAIDTFVPGDANGDGSVDRVDLAILVQNYGMASGASLQQGDFNFDGKVSLADLLLLKTNYTGAATLSGAAAVPEPSSVSLLVIAIAALWVIHSMHRWGIPRTTHNVLPMRASSLKSTSELWPTVDTIPV